MICLHLLNAWGKGWTQSPTVTFLFFLLLHNVSLLSEIYFYLLYLCVTPTNHGFFVIFFVLTVT